QNAAAAAPDRWRRAMHYKPEPRQRPEPVEHAHQRTTDPGTSACYASRSPDGCLRENRTTCLCPVPVRCAPSIPDDDYPAPRPVPAGMSGHRVLPLWCQLARDRLRPPTARSRTSVRHRLPTSEFFLEQILVDHIGQVQPVRLTQLDEFHPSDDLIVVLADGAHQH